MWSLPGPGIEPMSPALAGGFLTTGPPGKSLSPCWAEGEPHQSRAPVKLSCRAALWAHLKYTKIEGILWWIPMHSSPSLHGNASAASPVVCASVPTLLSTPSAGEQSACCAFIQSCCLQPLLGGGTWSASCGKRRSRCGGSTWVYTQGPLRPDVILSLT